MNLSHFKLADNCILLLLFLIHSFVSSYNILKACKQIPLPMYYESSVSPMIIISTSRSNSHLSKSILFPEVDNPHSHLSYSFPGKWFISILSLANRASHNHSSCTVGGLHIIVSPITQTVKICHVLKGDNQHSHLSFSFPSSFVS